MTSNQNWTGKWLIAASTLCTSLTFFSTHQLQVQPWSVSIWMALFWGDPPVFANNCLIGPPESLEPEAPLDPFIKTEECQYWHSQPFFLKSTACWFVTNVACLPHTTNLLICRTRNLEQQQNLEFYQLGVRIFLLLRFEIRNRFAITN